MVDWIIIIPFQVEHHVVLTDELGADPPHIFVNTIQVKSLSPVSGWDDANEATRLQVLIGIEVKLVNQQLFRGD